MEREGVGEGEDPVERWAAPGGETGLEEPMWQLGLNSGPEMYPDRPGEMDCVHYLRTGFCGFGDRCRYNHPLDSVGVGAMRGSGGEYPERIGQPVCQYYMRTGMCKFGSSCKYNHPKHGGGSAAPVNLNIYGYPLRPGEKECTYFVKTGQCKFGVTCKYHHPEPAGFHVPGPGSLAAPVPAVYPTLQSPSVQSSQQYGVVSGNWPVMRPALLPGSYIPGAYGPMLLPPGMLTVPGWTPYPVPVGLPSPSTQPTYGANSIYGITQLSPSASAYAGQYLPGPPSSSQKEHAYRERPGQPECQHYMKTGDCKYGYSCKYHHPQEWNGPTMNSDSLPFHPGVPVCAHFEQNGVCKYGTSCRFDHPTGSLSHSPSASSLTDMPVTPYPVGSSAGTSAPASSSSDLRPELVSGSAVAHSTPLQHEQNSTPPTSTSDTGQQGVHGEAPNEFQENVEFESVKLLEFQENVELEPTEADLDKRK